MFLRKEICSSTGNYSDNIKCLGEIIKNAGAIVPEEIRKQSVCIDADIGKVMCDLLELGEG